MTVSLVTGASGFVGAEIARAFKARGDEVIAMADKALKTKKN